MTIANLHKQLGKLIARGYARKRVVINKQTFSHPLESDGCCMLDVTGASIGDYILLNDDGGTLQDNGNEKYVQSLILTGN